MRDMEAVRLRRRAKKLERARLGRVERESRLFKCARRDCTNPRKCFNRRGLRISSGKARRAVKRAGVWYRREGSNQRWEGCRWVKKRDRSCNRKDPRLEKVTGVWRYKPLSERRGFVKRRGRWFRSKYSNYVWKDCRWTPMRKQRRNCRDPTVRRVAGRWIKRTGREVRGMVRHLGKWYMNKDRAYVYRNCRWVRSVKFGLKAVARKVERSQAKVPADKARLAYWKAKERAVIDSDAALREMQKKYPAQAGIGKMTRGDMKAAVDKLVPRINDKEAAAFISRFMKHYYPRGEERFKKGPYKNPKALYGNTGVRYAVDAPLNPNPLHGAAMGFPDDYAPEPNDHIFVPRVEGRKIFTSADMVSTPFAPEVDARDPEPGISGDYEPGAQLRNAGKSSHQQLRVIGEEELLRNPQEDQSPLMPEQRSALPSLSFSN